MPSTRAELLDRISSALHVLGARMSTVFRDELDALDLSMPMATALRELDEPMAMSALAGRLACDASYITGLADQLEERGLVRRTADPDDRRVKHLVRTDRGAKAAADVHERMLRSHPIISPLSDDELGTLVVLLEKAMAATDETES